MRQTLRKTWAIEVCMLFTAVSRPSNQWFCLVQPPKHCCLKSVPKHEWKKIKSLSVGLSFPKVSNCSVFSNCIPLFPRFLFPLGARTFSVPIGHLFPTFGAELKRYLSRNSYVPTQRCTFTMPCRCGQTLIKCCGGVTPENLLCNWKKRGGYLVLLRVYIPVHKTADIHSSGAVWESR